MNLQEQINRIQLMMGLNEKKSNKINWVKPDFSKEEDEFTGHFLRWLEDDVLQINFDNYSDKEFDELFDKIKDSYSNAEIKPLSDKEWSKMENTDSWNIESEKDLFDVIQGMWGRSKERITKHSIEPIKNGGKVETPIVAYVKGHPPYLIAGNTRLSVCKIMGITPKVTKVLINKNLLSK